jgi:hypothetical protein
MMLYPNKPNIETISGYKIFYNKSHVLTMPIQRFEDIS